MTSHRIYVVVAVTLLLLLVPSAALHVFAPAVVLVRDVLLVGAAIIGSLGLLREAGKAGGPLWLIVWSVVVGLGPLAIFPETHPTLLIVGKWITIWIVAYVVGFRAAHPHLRDLLIAMVCAYLALAVINEIIGLHERFTGQYWLPHDALVQTRTGGNVYRLHMLGDIIRVKGFNRESAEFSNILIVGFGICIILLPQLRYWRRIAIGVLALFLFIGSGASGTRSQLIGGVYSLVFGGLFFGLERLGLRRSLSVAKAIMVVVTVMVGVIGLNVVVDAFGKALFRGSIYSDQESTWMRVDAWGAIIDMAAQSKLHVVGGLGVAKLMGLTSASPVLTDNQYLWCFYHLGVLGSAIVGGAMICGIGDRSSGATKYAYMIALAMLIGEGLAKDVFVYMTSAFFFFVVGFGRAVSFQRVLRERRATSVNTRVRTVPCEAR